MNTLTQIRQSIRADYINLRLLRNQNVEKVITHNGLIACKEDTVTVSGKVYFKYENVFIRLQPYLYSGTIDLLPEQIANDYKGNACYFMHVKPAKIAGGKTVYAHTQETIQANGNLFVNNDETLSYYDIILTEEGRYMIRANAYEWADGKYHDHPEPLPEPEYGDYYDWEVNGKSGTLFSYASGHNPPDLRTELTTFGIGFEIEKNAYPEYYFTKEGLKKMGYVIERDSTVYDGFELKTPIFDLFNDSIFSHLKQIEFFCNVSNNDNAGGHINLSMKGKTDEELLDSLQGWLPLVYAMHRGRINNSYCTGKAVDLLKQDKEKYQSIRLHGSRIEFRIVGAVKSYENLCFRIRLFRIMCKNLDKSFAEVMRMAITPKTALNNLLTSGAYRDEARFIDMLKSALEIGMKYNHKIHKNSINSLSKKLDKCV